MMNGRGDLDLIKAGLIDRIGEVRQVDAAFVTANLPLAGEMSDRTEGGGQECSV